MFYTWPDIARLTVIVGHFGSGKTEVSVNLALHLASQNKTVSLADLDVVDPYFRSRGCAELFAQKGIRLVSSSPGGMDADLPSMPPEVLTIIEDPGIHGVFDIGGDASGARVLARYRRRLKDNNAKVLCVINANRPLTDTAEKAISYIRGIETSSGLSVDGLINNTHLCMQTELQDILSGSDLIAEVSSMTGIPIVCHTAPRQLAMPATERVQPVFPIDLYMKKPWE